MNTVKVVNYVCVITPSEYGNKFVTKCIAGQYALLSNN